MAIARPELDQRLNELEARLPAMIRENPDPADFWPEFAGLADTIADAAESADVEWVQNRLHAMLRHHGAPEAT